MNQVNSDYSIKPFLLDAILRWAMANEYTPTLVVGFHEDRVLPDHLQKENVSMVFNMGKKAVMDRKITTEGVSFKTYFKEISNACQVFLPVESWEFLRIKETGEIFNLAFFEQSFDGIAAKRRWPHGIELISSEEEEEWLNFCEIGVSKDSNMTTEIVIDEPVAEKPKLRLVWSNDGADRDKNQE